MKKVNEIFTLTREVNPSTGSNCFLARLEGGLILLAEVVVSEGKPGVGVPEQKAFTFMCVAEGPASIQFATMGHDGKVLLEEVLPVEIKGVLEENLAPDPVAASVLATPTKQQVSKISCVNAAGFVQEFCVMWGKGENQQTEWSQRYTNPNSKTIDLDKYVIPDGTEVWVKVNAIWGKTKEAGDKVIYKKGCNNVATYRTKGATLTYSIKLEN